MRSLLGRLLLVVLGVALMATVATALVAERITREDLEAVIQRDLQDEQEVFRQLTAYGSTFGSWSGVESALVELEQRIDQRIAITQVDGTVIADSAGTDDPPGLPAREVAFLDPETDGLSNDFPDDPAFELFDTDVLIECFEEAGIPYEVIEDDAGFEFIAPLLSDDEASEELGDLEAVEWCYTGFGPEVSDEEPESLQALLFIGTAADEEPSLLSGGPDGRLVLVILGVFSLAGLLTWIAVRRLLSPVDQLASAATAIGSGDLSARVPVGGADELVRLSTSFNQMATSIETEDVRRKQFTSDVAHELRTPLANVRGYLEAAQDGVVPIDRELVDSLHDDALLLQHLVDDLQVLTLAEAGQLRVTPESIDVDELIESVRLGHHAKALEKGVTLVAESNPVIITGDPHRLRQVLGNLVSNAIRHTESGGEVRLSTDRTNDTVRLHVSDDGEGIDAEHLPRLFERFYRVDTSRTRATGGTGLGLAIAKELVESHHGSLAVESVRGEGSIFTVSLPLRPQTL